MVKKLIWSHVFPIIVAVAIVYGALFIVKQNVGDVASKVVTHLTIDNSTRLFVNLTESDSAEAVYMSSIKETKYITLFGSSEFASLPTPYYPFLFLPDSVGIDVLAIGHAHHQHLSILIELLAAKPYLQNAKVAILISPGWFDEGGTNTAAFVEHARPNFLKKILLDATIDYDYKEHIGKFIAEHEEGLNGLTKEMKRFKKLYTMNSSNFFVKMDGELTNFIRGFFPNAYSVGDVTYQVNNIQEPKELNKSIIYDSLYTMAQRSFVNANSNIYHVDQGYFDQYLVGGDGQVKGPIALEDKDYLGDQEFKDFEMVLKLLKENEVDASFVIEPLNPYFYTNLKAKKALIEKLESSITDAGFPLLNMYVYDTDSYVPCTLSDVMHVGECGWIRINQFLQKIYE